MSYLSPRTILAQAKLPIAGHFDQQQLILAKRVMLAEIDLSETKSVVLNGQEFTKDAALRYFDELQSQGKLAYHLAIAEDEALCDFLEWGTLPKRDFLPNPLYQNPDFNAFVGAWYVESYAGLLIEVFKQGNEKKAEQVFALPKLWTAGEMDYQFARTLNRALDEFSGRIRLETEHIAGGKYFRFANLEHDFFKVSQIHILNRWPDGTLVARSRYAYALIALADALYDKGENKKALRIMENLFEGWFEPHVADQISERENLYKNYVSPDSPKGKRITARQGANDSNDEGFNWWWILWLIFIVARIASGC
jgi:hypothetical protein